MSRPGDREQLDRVRDRFTRTVTVFSDYVLASRGVEANSLVELVGPRGDERALDIACGPGTLARVFAPRVRWICGLDVTPAMLERARRTAAEDKLSNFLFACGDAVAIPIAAGKLDLAVGSYCLHHLSDPAAVLRELARVLRPGGRTGMLDMIVPDDPARAETNNKIERVRDHSHVRTLSAAEMERMVVAAGFRVVAKQKAERPRSFDEWMGVAGLKRGDAAYEEVRRLMEISIPGDTAAFTPRLVAHGKDGNDIEFMQRSFFLVGEKM